MAVFPRGHEPTDPLRPLIKQTNTLLARRCDQNAALTYLDIGEKFLTTNGLLPFSLMPDGTHPSDAGYQLWADILIKAGVNR